VSHATPAGRKPIRSVFDMCDSIEHEFEGSRSMTTRIQQSSGSAHALLKQARLELHAAAEACDAGERFRLAHLSALRTAAAAVALRGRSPAARGRLVSVWVRLQKAAPEYAEWATYFAAGARTRAAVEAGAALSLPPHVADDQLRSAGEFLALVEASLGMLAA
jgi:hypothetical protein